MAESRETGDTLPDAAVVLTFLIADIRGYTRFTLERGDAAAAHLADRFGRVVENVVGNFDGRVVELRGDEALVVFTSTRQALRAATALQERAFQEGGAFVIGIGLDAGEALPVGSGFRGAALNLAARLCSMAAPGEILASDTVAALARKLDDLQYVDRGMANLKGFAQPVRVIGVVSPTRGPGAPGNNQGIAGSDPVDSSTRPPPPPEPSSRTTGVQTAQDIAIASFPAGGFLGAIPDGPLVAREVELQRLLVTLDELAAGGGGRLLLVAGEAGVGKTRLCQEAMLAALDRGVLVATGRCYESYNAVPFYPFREAMTALYEAAPASLGADVPVRWPHLARLLPGLSLAPPPAAENSHEEQQRFFWAVTAFLQVLASRTPVALMLDDLHWADASTLELLQHLARQTRGSPVLLLGSYRDGEIGPRHPLQRLILDLGREHLSDRIPIRRMDRASTAALMAATVGDAGISPDLAAVVYARTEGNAFFTQEVLRSLMERGEIFRDGDSWAGRPGVEIDVPDTVRAAIDQRLLMLGAGSREVLDAASVLGQRFSFDDLQALLGCEEDALERALEEASTGGLVRVDHGDEYSFNHALTQQAVYTELSNRRKRRLHLAAGNALERLPERARDRRATELAQHFLQGGEPERGLPYAVAAGDAAEAVFAHEDAATQYAVALDLARLIGDDAQEARVRERLGGLLTATIQYAAALSMLEDAARMYRASGNWESEGRVVAQIGRVHVLNGTIDDGLLRVAVLRPLLDDHGPSPALAGLISALAHLLYADSQYEEALKAASEATALADRVGAAGVQAEAQARRGSALGMLGRYDDASQSLRSAILLANRAEDAFTRCRASQALAGIALLRGDAGESRLHLQDALALAEHMGNRRQIAVSSYALAVCAFADGDVATSSIWAERAIVIMRALEGSWATACQIAGFAPAVLPPMAWGDVGHYLQECMDTIARGPAHATKKDRPGPR